MGWKMQWYGCAPFVFVRLAMIPKQSCPVAISRSPADISQVFAWFPGSPGYLPGQCPPFLHAERSPARSTEPLNWPADDADLTDDVLPWADRRLYDRLPAKEGSRAEIRRWGISAGPDLAEELVDLSEVGIRVRLQTAVRRGERLDVTLWLPGALWCIRSMGIVCWSVIGADRLTLVGIHLRRRLTAQDFRQLVDKNGRV